MNLSRCCRGSVNGKSTSMDRESINQTKSFSMDQEAVEKLSRHTPESSMDQVCDKIYRGKKTKVIDRCESIKDLSRSCKAWRKWVFQSEEKHIEINAMQATQT